MDTLMKEDEFLKPDSDSQSKEDQLPQDLLNEIDLVLGELFKKKIIPHKKIHLLLD